MEQQEIKALNKIEIEGVLLDSKLEYFKNEKGEVDGIKGTVTVQVSEDNKPKINIYQGKYTKPKDGSTPKVRKAFTTLEDIMNGTIKSIGTATEDEPAGIVSVWSGNEDFTPYLEENINPKTGASTIRNSLGFGNFNVKETESKRGLRAEFEIECYVNSIMEEKDANGEWTGRAIANVSIPTVKKGLTNLLLILPDVAEDEEGEFPLAEEVLDSLDDFVGYGIYFYGDIINLAIEEEVSRQSSGRGRGRKKVETKTTFESALVVQGYDFLEDEGVKHWEDEEIATLRKEREAYIENEKKKSEEKAGENATTDKRDRTGSVGGARTSRAGRTRRGF